MGEPSRSNVLLPERGLTKRTEPSKYLEEKKPIRYSPSSGERNGISLNLWNVIACVRCFKGVVGEIRSGMQFTRLQFAL